MRRYLVEMRLRIRMAIHSLRLAYLFRRKSADQGYLKYLKTQLRRSLRKDSRVLPERAKHLIDKCVEFIPENGRVLCVGCRNRLELDYFRARGVRNVVGIDLFSECPDVIIMDMHELKFPSGSFDMVYSSHSLEHSISPERAVREFARVLKPGGMVVIEVPANYDSKRTGADLHDFRTVERIVGLFADFSPRVLWQQTNLPLDAGTDVIRAVIRLQGAAVE